MCVSLFMMASHYSPDTMVWACAAAICRSNPFSKEMLGTSIVEGFVRVGLIEKSAKSWRFSLATGEEGVLGQRAFKPIAQPEVQASQLSSEHGEGKEESGMEDVEDDGRGCGWLELLRWKNHMRSLQRSQ